jgi:hypothetical protein
MPLQLDLEELLSQRIPVTKLEAAKAQLITAIRLFFQGVDPVSTHTLTCAAHGLLHDLAKSKGIKISLKDSTHIASEERKDFFRGLTYSQNFFKHSDRDPDAIHRFPHGMTRFLLLDSAILYFNLAKELPDECRIFFVWIQLRYPEVLTLHHIEELLAGMRSTTTDPAAFAAIARALLAGAPQPVKIDIR